MLPFLNEWKANFTQLNQSRSASAQFWDRLQKWNEKSKAGPEDSFWNWKTRYAWDHYLSLYSMKTVVIGFQSLLINVVGDILRFEYSLTEHIPAPLPYRSSLRHMGYQEWRTEVSKNAKVRTRAAEKATKVKQADEAAAKAKQADEAATKAQQAAKQADEAATKAQQAKKQADEAATKAKEAVEKIKEAKQAEEAEKKQANK